MPQHLAPTHSHNIKEPGECGPSQRLFTDVTEPIVSIVDQHSLQQIDFLGKLAIGLRKRFNLANSM